MQITDQNSSFSIAKPNAFYQIHRDLVDGVNLDTGELVCGCRRTQGMYLFNKETKKIKYVNCKAYICEFCGVLKIQRFRNALKMYLSSWKFIRLFTFTQHTPDKLSVVKQNKNFAKAWQIFVKNVRRDKSLSKKQLNFQYVKIVEFTERGYLHYHVVIDNFLPIKVIRKIWDEALYSVFGYIGGRGGINIKVTQNSNSCVKYLTKYITKMSSKKFVNLRRWSKSGKVALFEVFVSDKNWIFFRLTVDGVLNLNNKSITIQKPPSNLVGTLFEPTPVANIKADINFFFFGKTR